MNNKNKPALWIGFSLIALSIVYGTIRQLPPPNESEVIQGEELLDILGLDELLDGTYYTLVDESENILMRTARLIYPGNQYLTHDNKLYEVETVENKVAQARFIKAVRLAGSATGDTASLLPIASLPVQQQTDKRIGIYHTHGAESYVPTDGTESQVEGGGIIQVGEAFAEGLRKKNIQPIQSKETHVPHDAGAYDRSRRTAVDLLGKNPDAIFDVHRDAVPEEEYAATVHGQEIAQIQFVVGQQNQNQSAIEEFAQGLKQISDEKYPGLIKGIFFAKGNYNQDLAPHTLLLEVGTHESSREQAERAVRLFADTTSTYFYGDSATAHKAKTNVGRKAGSSILWLLLVTALAGGGYLYISTGSWEKAQQKLQQFLTTEFLDVLGRKPPKKDD